MLLELHCHSSRYSSCSRIAPEQLLREAARQGLQGLVLTEHQYLWPAAELASLRREAGVSGQFLILAGQEVETELGHVLVYGATESIAGRVRTAALRAAWPEAALVLAHPFRGGRLPGPDRLRTPCLDAIEIFNLNHTVRENWTGLLRWHELKFTATAGSDTHAPGLTGIFPTQFDHPVTTIAGVAAEIRAGRCRPFFKEIPRAGSHLNVTEITMGTKGPDEQRQRIILKQYRDGKTWERARDSARLSELLHRSGFDTGRCRVPRVVTIDDAARLLIEEGQRGKNLFEVLVTVAPAAGREFFQLAGEWLGRLHALRLRLGEPGATWKRETRRLTSYAAHFADTGSPYAAEVAGFAATVRAGMERLFAAHPAAFVQNHGDYHPRNLIIGHDLAHDSSTRFVSVIDFDSMLLHHPAFDAGYFLAQCRHQFGDRPELLAACPPELFLAGYRAAAGALPDDFDAALELFALRGALSIGSYLVKVGLGTSPEMARLLEYCRRQAARLATE